jgi:hypothetical protein
MGGEDRRVPVLYVGGMPRSGSTLLDLMLSQFDGHCGVGELFYLWLRVERDLRCACGEPFSQCTFWVKVGEVAYGGWSTVDLQEVYRLQRQVDATSKLPQILAARLLPRFRRRLDRYTELITPLYRAIAEVSGARVVVDSTKRPSLAYSLRRAPGIDLRMVHILRDPRGVAYSWSQLVELPEGTESRTHMRTRSPALIGRRWVTVNLMTAALSWLGVRRVTLRYEDLVRDPYAELGRVAALTADVMGTPDARAFLSGTTFTPGTLHTVAGGRIRMSRGPITLRLDEKWRREYKPATRRLVAAMTWPLRWLYRYYR